MLGLHKFVYILFVAYPLGSVNNYARTTWGGCLVLVIVSSCTVVRSKFVDSLMLLQNSWKTLFRRSGICSINNDAVSVSVKSPKGEPDQEF